MGFFLFNLLDYYLQLFLMYVSYCWYSVAVGCSKKRNKFVLLQSHNLTFFFQIQSHAAINIQSPAVNHWKTKSISIFFRIFQNSWGIGFECFFFPKTFPVTDLIIYFQWNLMYADTWSYKSRLIDWVQFSEWKSPLTESLIDLFKRK